MRTVNKKAREARKVEIMEKCFACYCDNGLNGVGIKAIAKACDINSATLYQYFDNLDDLIVKSTAYCMEKVEDDFMELAPTDPEDILRFVKEVPYWTAKKHGKKYRLMYQVYTHPKYIEYGKQFFKGVNVYFNFDLMEDEKVKLTYTTDYNISEEQAIESLKIIKEELAKYESLYIDAINARSEEVLVLPSVDGKSPG